MTNFNMATTRFIVVAEAVVFCVILPSITALPEQGVWNIPMAEVKNESAKQFC